MGEKRKVCTARRGEKGETPMEGKGAYNTAAVSAKRRATVESILASRVVEAIILQRIRLGGLVVWWCYGCGWMSWWIRCGEAK